MLAMFVKRRGVSLGVALLLQFGMSTTADAAFASIPDGRVSKLERFFQSYGCPSPHYSADYIRAADAHQLDYRLLPAISLVESTCGLHEQRIIAGVGIPERKPSPAFPTASISSPRSSRTASITGIKKSPRSF